MNARRSEARRLERELFEAREEIVRLHGRLETVSASDEPAVGLSELEKENRLLRRRLQEVEDISERCEARRCSRNDSPTSSTRQDPERRVPLGPPHELAARPGSSTV